MLSSEAMLHNALLSLAIMDWPEGTVYLCAAPISHGAGSLIVPNLWRGGTVLLQQGFDPDRWLDAVEANDDVISFVVPTMLYRLLDHPRTRTADLRGVHTLIYGAAPINPARLQEALDVFGPVLHQRYGQTECPNTILALTKQDHLAGGQRLESAGRPCPGIDVALLDVEGDRVPPGSVGEICVRGPLVMSGYWNQPELTDEVFRNEWLHTGDLAREDDCGFYYIAGRLKDMIITGGFNVYPREVEDVLVEHPAVSAAAVLGLPDPNWGEAVTAVVVAREGATVSADELIHFVKQQKGSVSAPKAVHFISELPLTPLGKPDKASLRALLNQVLL